MGKVLRDFKDFLMQGNLITLAVAFVMGVAFAAVLNSFVKDLIMPIIGAIFGKTDFSSLTFTIHNSLFKYGSFITALITFGVDPLWLTPRSAPGLVESGFLTQAASLVLFCNSYSIGVSMPRLEWRRRRLWKISMYSKIALASSTRVLQRRVSRSSTCIRDQNASIIALS